MGNIDIIELFIWLSLCLSVVQVYLRINKIWKRKHDKEVADSQSILGLFLFLANSLAWVVYYFVNNDFNSIADTGIYIIEASVFMIISTGFWVRRPEKIKIWTLIKQALNLERKEADYLIKRFFKPQNAESIIGILHQLAMIDNELAEKELVLLKAFAEDWGIEYNFEDYKNNLGNNHFIKLRNSLLDFLKSEPQLEQVTQLKDMMTEIVKADEKISEEEDLIVTELMGLLENYINKDAASTKYLVIVVPQKPEHDIEIKTLKPQAEKIHAAGGIAYQIDSFYSLKYANMICNEYRNKNLFTIVHTPSSDVELSVLNE